MKTIKIFLTYIFIIALIYATFVNTYSQCGKERWDVKTLTDPDTSLINWNDTIKTTIKEQCDTNKFKLIKKGKRVPRKANETQLYEITAYIIGCKLESDKDYHVVISDENDNTMIVEISSPECPEVQNCSHYSEIVQVRDWFKSKFKPTTKYKKFKKTELYRLIGIGFSDFIHGQTGVAPSGRELHPVINIEEYK
jgi:hypothetical protein